MSIRIGFVSPTVLASCLGAACAPLSPAHTRTGFDEDTAVAEPIRVVYDDGFSFQGKAGRDALRLGGIFQTAAGLFSREREPSTDFILKRMRPEISGRFDQAFVFNLEPNFSDEGVELEEAWVGMELGGGMSKLIMGRMKAPFLLEEVRSLRHIDFPRFSILDQFAPAEDHGVFLNGLSATGRWEYGLALYNGTGSSDTTSSKDVAARLMLHPAAGDESSPLENLQLGLSGTWGRQEESVGEEGIAGALGLPLIRYVPALFLSGRRWRAGFEFAWFDGPLFLQSEAIAVQQQMEAGAGTSDIGFKGYYLMLARVLTGEDKTFAGVVPSHPFRSDQAGGSGAWVLALRASGLHIDDDLRTAGFAEFDTFTSRVHNLSLGLNWIPNEHVIVRNALVASRFGERVTLDTGSVDHEFGFLVEVQLHF